MPSPVSALFACAWLVGGLCLCVAATAAVTDEAHVVDGLSAPAEIRIDEWGVAHIYANAHYDAFFVQGFNAARDRLWQIDLWRRRGLGKLAEALGPDYLAQDRAARLFLYRGDMYREWLAYGSDAKIIAEAFVAGINAYLDVIAKRPERLPFEFRALGYAPERWAAEDVVRIRSHGLWRNVQSEVRRARIYCRASAAADRLKKRLEPAWTPQVPQGLDPCSIPDGVLADYELATSVVKFAGAHIAANTSAASAVDTGSNNWVVAPSRTATGRPILANDPHRAHAVPSLRYAVHLVAPELDVIGAGEPALPGISTGHNQRIAFGLTIFAIDQEDLYVYEVDPADAGRYRYAGAWEPFTVQKESIAVAGAAPATHELRFTRHGPVVFVDPEHKRAFAVRAAWLEPGMAPYFGSIEYMRAGNWREFAAALNRWGAPGENQVYADVDGNIGYKPAGLFPRRTRHDGLLPVPGDGRFEWDGFFDMDALPSEVNPKRGFIATANALTLPPDYPIDERRVGFEWTAPWRQRRIDEVLVAQPKHSLADSLALQRDYTSTLARDVIDALPESAGAPADVATRLARLKAWDKRLDPESADAAFFVVWWDHHLLPALGRELAGVAYEFVQPVDSLVARDALASPSQSIRDAVFTSLRNAEKELHTLLGADPTQWRWGDLHRIRFAHPLIGRLDPDLAARVRLPDYPRGGSADTPNSTGFANGFDVVSGASWRFVADVGNWDATRMTNAPGQSGNPDSPFYGSLLENWATDSSVPLLYTRKAVEAHTRSIIRLTPPGDGRHVVERAL